MKFRIISLSLASLACITAAGCSSNKPDHPEIKAELTTRITEDGSKLFTYSATLPERKKQRGMGPPPGGQSRSGPPPGGSKAGANKDREERLTQQIENKLAETGYCREGYLTWEKTITKGNLKVYGECKEAASDKDRKVFTNS